MHNVYSDTRWAKARDAAIHRDSGRCTVARLFGGDCHPTLHVHHVTPLAEGGAPYDLDNLLTACQSHHPQLEAMRRYVLRQRKVPPCRHRHFYDHARRECLERRLRQAA